MYVNSDGPGAGDCEGDAALEPNCGNDQPVAELLRSSLEPLLIDHQVRSSVGALTVGRAQDWFTLSFCHPQLVSYNERATQLSVVPGRVAFYGVVDPFEHDVGFCVLNLLSTPVHVFLYPPKVCTASSSHNRTLPDTANRRF